MTRARAMTPPLAIAASGADAMALAESFRNALPSGYAAVVRTYDRAAGTAACPSDGVCVVVTGQALPDRLTAGARVAGALRAAAPPATIESVSSPARVSLHAMAAIEVSLRAPVTRVEVFDGPMLVGEAAASDGGRVSVPWAPMMEGVRKLHIVAGDDARDVAVEVDARRLPVLYYEAETTWLGTFVRRAVQDDRRFAVSGRTQVAPPVTVAHGPAVSLTAAALADVPLVVVSVPDQLRASDVDVLERFVSTRGGSLVVLLDRRPAGPILRLLPRIVEQRLEREPRRVGSLRAAELLTFETVPGIDVIDRDDQRAITVVRHVGRGRVIASGALDAWRHRDDTNAFDAYWTGLLWNAAVAAGSELNLTAAPLIAHPGQPIGITAELQSMDPIAADLGVEARYECGDERGVLRMWPEARRGVFSGTLQRGASGGCVVSAALGGRSGEAHAAVSDDLQTADDRRRFEAAIAAHGGVMAEQGQTEALLARLRELMPARDEPRATYPMRSALWLIPFAACLCAEWWLRRRAGLR